MLFAANNPYILIEPGPQVKPIEQVAGKNLAGIKQLLQANSRFLFFIDDEGLWRYDGYRLKRFIHPKAHVFKGMVKDIEGYLWLASEQGLSRFDERSGRFDDFALGSIKVQTLALGRGNRLWLGGDPGLYQFNLKTHETSQVHNSHHSVTEIIEDHLGRLWFSGASKSVVYLLGAEPPVKQFALDGQQIHTLVQTRDGDIWVGTGRGLYRYQAVKNAFSVVQQPLTGAVEVIFEDRSGNIWIAVAGQGIAVKYFGQNHFKAIEVTTGAPSSLPVANYLSITQDQNGGLWFTTADSGLFLLDMKDLAIQYRSLGAEHRWQMRYWYLDTQGVVWVGTDNGLYRFVRAAIELYPVATGIGAVNAIVEREPGVLLLEVEDKGLLQFNSNSQKFEPLQGLPAISQISALAKDEYSNDKGSVSLDSLKDISKSDFAVGTVRALISNRQGGFWLATDKGLVRFQSQTGQAWHYGKHRIHWHEVTQSSMLQLSASEVVVADSRGLIAFDPKQLALSDSAMPKKSRVLMSGLKLSGGAAELKQSLAYTEQITLPAGEPWFSVEIAATQFTAQDRAQYGYKLIGRDRHWIEITQRPPQITFIDLPAGEYQLHIRTTDTQGNWVEGKPQLAISIKAPAWHFYLVAAVSFVLCIVVLACAYYWRLKHTTEQQREATKPVASFAQFKPLESGFDSIAVNEEVMTPDTDDSRQNSKQSEPFIEQLEKVLAENVGNSLFNVTILARQLHTSKRQLHRKMQSLMGMTPLEAIRGYRLKMAAQLLLDGESPSNVTYDVGFTSHSYFSACFKAKYGCNPSDYKARKERPMS